jgi:hypothetical protein
MMRASTLLRHIIEPTLELLDEMARIPHTRQAERMLIAIALQESGLRHRVQVTNNGPGPARGLWQFERGGGVTGVLGHRGSSRAAHALCAELLVTPDPSVVHDALAQNDLLACGFARLLLWTDHRPLPDSEAAGWDYYLRNWRPGKPHPQTWARHWRTAEETLI